MYWTISCGNRTYIDVRAPSFGAACKSLGLDPFKCKVIRCRS